MADEFAIIIPVFNEAENIGQTLCHLSQTEPLASFEVIVVDASPQGRTISTIQSAADVQKMIAPKGRALQMNAGAELSRGEVLLFLHADTRLPHNWTSEIRRILARQGVVAGAFDLGIDSKKPIFRLIERAASLRSRITGIPYGDQAIFIRKQFFQQIGGFRPIPIMEDVDLMKRVKKSGGRISISPFRVATSARRWQKEGIIRCTLRNWALIGLYAAGVKPDRLAKFYP